MIIQDLYSIQSFQNEVNSLRATIKINSKHPIFNGHFPEMPITPGVIQIQIVKELVEKAIGKDFFIQHLNRCKFLSTIDPNKNPIVHFSVTYNQNEDKSYKIQSSGHYDDTVFIKFNATLN